MRSEHIATDPYAHLAEKSNRTDEEDKNRIPNLANVTRDKIDGVICKQ